MTLPLPLPMRSHLFIHQAKSPSQWDKSSAVASSPACMGGSKRWGNGVIHLCSKFGHLKLNFKAAVTVWTDTDNDNVLIMRADNTDIKMYAFSALDLHKSISCVNCIMVLIINCNKNALTLEHFRFILV